MTDTYRCQQKSWKSRLVAATCCSIEHGWKLVGKLYGLNIYPKAISWPLQQKKLRVVSSTRYKLYPQCDTWLSAILSLQTLLLHALFADLRMLLKWAPPKQSSTSQLASWKNVPGSNSEKHEMRILSRSSWKLEGYLFYSRNGSFHTPATSRPSRF